MMKSPSPWLPIELNMAGKCCDCAPPNNDLQHAAPPLEHSVEAEESMEVGRSCRYQNFNLSKRGLSKPSPGGARSCRVFYPTRNFDQGKWDNCASRHSHTPRTSLLELNRHEFFVRHEGFDSVQLQTSLTPLSVGKFNLKLTFN